MPISFYDETKILGRKLNGEIHVPHVLILTSVLTLWNGTCGGLVIVVLYLQHFQCAHLTLQKTSWENQQSKLQYCLAIMLVSKRIGRYSNSCLRIFKVAATRRSGKNHSFLASYPYFPPKSRSFLIIMNMFCMSKSKISL